MYSFSQLSKHGRETASIEEIPHEEFAGWANVLLKRVCVPCKFIKPIKPEIESLRDAPLRLNEL